MNGYCVVWLASHGIPWDSANMQALGSRRRGLGPPDAIASTAPGSTRRCRRAGVTSHAVTHALSVTRARVTAPGEHTAQDGACLTAQVDWRVPAVNHRIGEDGKQHLAQHIISGRCTICLHL